MRRDSELFHNLVLGAFPCYLQWRDEVSWKVPLNFAAFLVIPGYKKLQATQERRLTKPTIILVPDEANGQSPQLAHPKTEARLSLKSNKSSAKKKI